MKLILRFLLDERGIFDPVSLGVMGLGMGLNVLGNSRKKGGGVQAIEPFPGYSNRSRRLSALGIEGATKDHTYGGSFDIDSPLVEQEAESQILGRLRNPLTVDNLGSDITEKYYRAGKERLGESFEDERKRTQDRYNRLGVATSTPGLNALGEIDKSQRLAETEFSTKLMYEDIAREIEATKMADDILNRYIGQAQVLGKTQRAGQQFEKASDYDNFLNNINTQLKYANLTRGVLGQNSPTTYQEPQEDNILSQLGLLGTDLGSMLFLSNILGN